MEILKKIRTVDIIIVAGIIIALIVGFFTFKHFRQTADKQIEATSQISFDVFINPDCKGTSISEIALAILLEEN